MSLLLRPMLLRNSYRCGIVLRSNMSTYKSPISNYNNLLKRKPILVGAVQAGVLMGAGDFVAQYVIEGTPLNRVDYIRSAKFFCLGLFFVVTISHFLIQHFYTLILYLF